MTKQRCEVAGGIHHLVGKSPSGRLLFRTDDDRRRYLVLLGEEVKRREWEVFTYCQMTNHVHLLVRTPEADLGDGVKIIHETFARECNQRYEEWGHLFGRRFFNGVVRSDRHFAGCMRYIA